MKKDRSTFLVLVAMLWLVVTTCPGGLVENGSFERRDAHDPSSPALWTGRASATDQPLEFSGEHYEGAACGVIPGDDKPHSWRQTIKNPPERTFSLSAMVKADKAAIGPDGYAFLYGHILYQGRPEADATHFFAKIPPGNYDWTSITASGVAAGDQPIAAVLVTVSGKLASGRISIDQVRLEPDKATTPAALLADRVQDLMIRVDRSGGNSGGMVECRAHLSTAAALLSSDPNNFKDATNEWLRASKSLTRADWAKVFPEVIATAPVEARMIYHGQAPSRAGCDRNLDIIESAGANAVYLSLGSWMSVTYRSDLLPTDSAYESDDTLKYFIEAAHQRNLKVFGYVAALYGTHEVPPEAKPLVDAHPDWFARGPDPNMPLFPDPANPQVAAFIAKVYAELVQRYELDGVGLDYIRYPTETALNYDEANRRQIESKLGIHVIELEDLSKNPEAWARIIEYRAAMTRNVVAQVRDAVKSTRRSCALIGCLLADPDEAKRYGQDWSKSASMLDFATPMNYDDVSGDSKLLARQRDLFQQARTNYIPAVGGMPDVHARWTLSTWAERIAMQRRVGCDGIIVYRLGDLDPVVVMFLGNAAFGNPARFPDVPSK